MSEARPSGRAAHVFLNLKETILALPDGRASDMLIKRQRLMDQPLLLLHVNRIVAGRWAW